MNHNEEVPDFLGGPGDMSRRGQENLWQSRNVLPDPDSKALARKKRDDVKTLRTDCFTERQNCRVGGAGISNNCDGLLLQVSLGECCYHVLHALCSYMNHFTILHLLKYYSIIDNGKRNITIV